MIRISAMCAAALLLAACDRTPTQSLRPADAALATAPGDAGITVLAGVGSASGINAAGQVAVEADGMASLWSDGVLTGLGSLPGAGESIAWGINDAGQVVGTSGGRAFVWAEGTGIVSLGPGTAEAISNAASPLITGGDTGPMVWEWDGSGWAATALPVLEGTFQGWGFGVNRSGAVAGVVGVAPGTAGFRAVVWERGAGGWTIQPLGALPGKAYAIANGINDAGQVSGWSGAPGTLAFLWENGEMRALQPLPGGTYSGAYRLNGQGHVAGSSNAADGRAHAVLWVDGVPIDLGMPQGATRCGAVEPNDLGQVVGYCVIGGVSRPVIWNAAVPLAGTLASRVEALEASGEISNAGTANSLRSKLAGVRAALDRGDTRVAANLLGAFASQLRAQAGKHVPAPAAEALIAMATAAQAYLAP